MSFFAFSLCILMQSVPVPAHAPAQEPLTVSVGGVAVDACVVDGLHPPAFKITFQDLPSLCVQRPWRTSSWVMLDECECVQ